MKASFDLKNKKGNLDFDAEKLIEKGMDQHEKNWKDKFLLKHDAKKEILELKHKQKLEIEHEKNKTVKEIKEKNSQKIFTIISVIMLFIYGLFCITGFRDSHIVSAIISLIQILFIVISIFLAMIETNLFKNDYKIFFLISFILIIPWLFFAV